MNSSSSDWVRCLALTLTKEKDYDNIFKSLASIPPSPFPLTYKVMKYLFGLVILDAEFEVDHLANAGVQRAAQDSVLGEVSVLQPQSLGFGLFGTATFLASATIPLRMLMAKI